MAVELTTTAKESAQKVAEAIAESLGLDLAGTNPKFATDRKSLVFAAFTSSLTRLEQTFPRLATNRIHVHY